MKSAGVRKSGMKNAAMKRLFAALAILLVVNLVTGMAHAAEPTPDRGEKVKSITLPGSGHLMFDGWTRAGRASSYRLPVKAGTNLKIFFKASSRFTYLVIFDLKGESPGDAFFSSDSQHLPAKIHAEKDMDLWIRPFFAKQSPRRGLGAHFEVEIRKEAADSPEFTPEALQFRNLFR